MATYTNITTNSDAHVTTLIDIGDPVGFVKKLTICNNDTLPAQNIDLYIENAGATKHYFIKGLDMPVSTSFVIEDIEFDVVRFALKILTNRDSGSGAPNLTVILQ